MSTLHTGAFSGEKITVDAMIKDPTYISNDIREDLDLAFLETALFRDGGDNQGVVAYSEAVSPFLTDSAEEVAEAAEIPISTLQNGKVKSIIGHKTALGVPVTLEEKQFNRIDQVTRKVTALKNTMTRTSVNATLKAFDVASVPVLELAADWENPAADPLKDIRTAKRMIREAKPDEAEDQKFGYHPDTLVISESLLEAALDHDNVQKFFIGNMAADNPSFKGILPSVLADLRLVTSSWLKEDEVYVLEAQTAGFYSDAIPLTVSDLYAPSGDNGYGGTTQSWRVDAFRHRIIAIDNPKAVVKLEGVIA
nr:hypothetical protein [Corynebacterium sp. UBA5992]